MIKFEKRMAELAAYCQEFDCGEREAMEDILIMFYETAGFWTDVLEAEVKSMSDGALMEAYLNL